MDRSSEIEFLREALRRRAEQTSIRNVADEVNMSHGGVYNLVTGQVVPYGKTLAKLRDWYLGQWAQGGEGLSTEAAHYLVQQMLLAIPRSRRAGAGVELLDAMEEVYRRYGTPPPPWLADLRDDLAQKPPARPPERAKAAAPKPLRAGK